MARSFELGNGGYPPDGTCGSPFINLAAQDRDPLGLYSCIVSDAPHKCNQCNHDGAPSVRAEHFAGFVKVELVADFLEALRQDETFSEARQEEIFSQPVDNGLDPNSPTSEVKGRGEIKLQRKSNNLCRIRDVEVDVSTLKNCPNCRFFIMKMHYILWTIGGFLL